MLEPSEMEQKVVSKVIWRLIPFMIFLYILNYLDRVNISYAKLQMKNDLGFDEAIFGYGIGIFFWGYFIFEVPSNLIMQRVGARRWIARIMISWGVVSTCMLFIWNAQSFYVMRVLLGVAEAGFFPGMIFYLTHWVPAKKRAQAGAMFLTSTALSGVVGGPIGGYILDNMSGVGGLNGWKWLFLLEGLPTIVMGVFTLFYLNDKPADAKWLHSEEREWLTNHLQAEHAHTHASHGLNEIKHAFSDLRVWLLCVLYFLFMFGFYLINYWTPTIIEKLSPESSKQTIGLLCAIPFLSAAVGMVAIGISSDRSGDRRWHLVGSSLMGAIGLIGCALSTSSLILSLLSISIAAVGVFGTLGPFWAVPPLFLSGAAAAAGIAWVNSVGNLVGGFVGPTVMGEILKKTGSYVLGCELVAGVLFIAAIVGAIIPLKKHTPGVPVNAGQIAEAAEAK